MFKYTLDNKKYHTFNYFLKNKFNKKVFKVAIDANFTCPNKKNGGCIFCSEGSKSNITNNKKSILEQFHEVKNIMHKKWPDAYYIPYLQANTNTYASVEKLKEIYEPLLMQENVVGLAIATRSDCITDEVYEYLSELSKRTFLMVEIGLQSSYDETLNLINRGHDYNNFVKCIERLKKLNIFTVVHIINGLPYENKEMMINTVKKLNELKIDAIKIHMLHIIKNTKLEELYEKEKFHVLTKDEYIDIVCDQLTYLDEKIVIERITGDPVIENLIEPKWLIKKFVLLNDIDKELEKRKIYQGLNT